MHVSSGRCQPDRGQADFKGSRRGKTPSLARRRQAVTHVRALGHSERCICNALGISRNTVRYFPQPRDGGLETRGAVGRSYQPVATRQQGRRGYWSCPSTGSLERCFTGRQSMVLS